MVWDPEAAKKKESEIRQRLKAEAEVLLELVVAELVKRGFKAEPIALGQRAGVGSGSARRRAMLLIGQQRVPLWIEQDRETGTLGRSIWQDWLRVSCDGIYGGFRTREIPMRSKTFARSKSREATYGFDVEKIADHCEAWAALDVSTRLKEELSDSALEAWEKAKERLVLQFPSAEGHLSATDKGLSLKLLVNEGQAVALLELLKLNEKGR